MFSTDVEERTIVWISDKVEALVVGEPYGVKVLMDIRMKKATESTVMKNEIIKKIHLVQFNNRIGLEMGLAILNLAKERNQNIAVQVERLNHIIFLYVDDNLPTDKHNWLRRKAKWSKTLKRVL